MLSTRSSTTVGFVGELPPREAPLTEALVEMAGTLVDDFDVLELLTRLTNRCIGVLDGSAAAIMLAGPHGDLRVMASSSESVRLLELFEIQSKEGPCIDCFRTGRLVVNRPPGRP